MTFSNNSIYTIGYGSRSFNEFLEIIKKYEIDFLIDIRSSPYSKYNPDYSKQIFESHLKKNNIQYVYMGDKLGGRPNDSSCYMDEKVDYEKLGEKDFFKEGLERLKTAWGKNLRIVLFCSEAKPEECHRSKLIGETLTNNGIDVAHIDENGNIKSQNKVIEILTNGQLTFFPQLSVSTSRKKVLITSDKK